MYLKDEDKQKISEEIGKIEKRSSAELVAVITEHSSNYWFFNLTISLIVAFIATVVSSKFNLSTMHQFEIVALCFFGIFIFLNFWKTPILFLLPKEYKYSVASKRASSEFVNLGLHKTETREAIMFYVSTKENFVKIICDKNIREKIDNSYWQKIVDEFIIDVKNEKFTQGYIKAIRACGDVLAEKFPVQEDDVNELSNEVIEL